MRFTIALSASRRLPDTFHNMPKSYVDRHTRFLLKRAPNLPQYTQKIFRYRHRAYYDRWRPWEKEFEDINSSLVKLPKIFVEPIKDWAFFRGDRVEVVKGPEEGKQGIIRHIIRERNWVFVEGVNLKRQYAFRSDKSLGALMAIEMPLLVNQEVKLVDPSDLMPTDVEWRYDDEGTKVRVSKRTERLIPIPESAYSTVDYMDRTLYKEEPKDTLADDALKVTYVPEVKTFEMDICEKMNIKEDRVPYPMYWY